MDHWPTPARSVRPRIKLKVYCDEGWPLGQVDFHTYPESQGWWKAEGGDEDFITPDDRPLQRPSYKEKSGANEFLQKWAYFGLVSEVMQAPVFGIPNYSPAKSPLLSTFSWLKSFVFTPPQSPLPVMDSSDLVTIYQSFIRKTRTEHAGNYEREGRAWACIQTNTSWLKRMREYETPQFDPDLIMSIETVLSDLVRTIHLAFEVIMRMPPASASEGDQLYSLRRHPEAPQIADSMSSGIFRSRMLADGWCPSNVKRIFAKTTDTSSRYFLSMLDRPRPHLRHDQDCNEDYCRHWKVDTATYTTAHVCDRGDCRWVTVPLQRLEEILASGQDTVLVIVPGVTDTADDGRLVVRLEAGSEETEYIAISHVWSDYLGNTTANEIPICQFERLSKMVQDAWGDSKICFWLDTLCFPYPTSPDKEAYQQALEKMRVTYEQAELVLVLDSSVVSDHELALRVLCSEWSTRLWTYQENRMAKRLKFVFGSTAVEIPFAILDNPVSANDGIWSPFESTRVVRPASLISGYSREKTSDLPKVYAELTYRATNVAEDESLCLANLMGLDPLLVTQIPPKERMEHIWRHADPVDAFRTLFWPCQRLTVDGLGWVPKSLLVREFEFLSSLIPSESQLTTLEVTATGDTRRVQKTAVRAKLDPRGLMFKCFYVMLSGLSQPICREFVCGGSGMDWYHVELTYDTEGRSVKWSERGCPLPRPSSPDRSGPMLVLFLLFPQVQEEQQLLLTNMAVLCHGEYRGQAPSEYGWQDHSLTEVQSLGIVRVSRHSKFRKENRMIIYNPVEGPDGTVHYLCEQIQEQNGVNAYNASWRAEGCCNLTPEDTARLRANIPRNDARNMPPQRLLIGEPAPTEMVFFMR